MRFQPRQSTPNYLGRREQRRLLTIVILLGLVFFLMQQARKPANWHWFVALNNPGAGGQAEPGQAIDTRLQPLAEAPQEPGTIQLPAQKPARPAAEYFAGVKPELLEAVRDDTVFRGAEHEAFFHLLETLHRTDQRTLDAASRGPTAFVQLYQQPDEYRGKLVTIRGAARGVFQYAAARNDYGIEKYYQVWIQPNDNPSLPLVIYVLDLPAGFPIADHMHEEVELTGFFFKRWAYRAQDAIRSAPLLLAKTVNWKPPPVANTEPVRLAVLGGIVLCASLIAGIVVWMALHGSTPASKYAIRPRRSGESKLGDGRPLGEVLKQLAEQAEAEAAFATGVPPAETRAGNQGPAS
jgi:hypothetical protein